MSDEHAAGATTDHETHDAPSGPPRSNATRTTLSVRFVRKLAIFLIAGLGLAIWGLVDAVWVYPNTANRYNAWAEHQYLKLARDQGRLRPSDVDIDDPAGMHAALDERRGEIQQGLTAVDRNRQIAAELEQARLQWLDGLSRLNQLDPQYTTYPDAAALDQRFAELDAEWTAVTSQPKLLAAYDIPMQWVFVATGLGIVVWQLAMLGMVSRRVYTFDPETKTLTLPGGTQLRPEDIETFDKRKWDRFLVFLGIRSEHPQLGGQELKLDLYRHNHLEDWVKEQFYIAHPAEYRQSFPEEFEAPEQETLPAEAGPDEAAAESDVEAEPVTAGENEPEEPRNA